MNARVALRQFQRHGDYDEVRLHRSSDRMDFTAVDFSVMLITANNDRPNLFIVESEEST